jgi:FtsP/CotA-like multicopper oxidase with cupredoxin domain
VFLLNAFDIEPGSMTPRVNTMIEFNLWAWNSRVFPGIDHLVVGRGDRVRIRMGNLTMTNHPIHIHGHNFTVSGTDGGWVPRSAQWPETTVDMPIGHFSKPGEFYYGGLIPGHFEAGMVGKVIVK